MVSMSSFAPFKDDFRPLPRLDFFGMLATAFGTGGASVSDTAPSAAETASCENRSSDKLRERQKGSDRPVILLTRLVIVQKIERIRRGTRFLVRAAFAQLIEVRRRFTRLLANPVQVPS